MESQNNLRGIRILYERKAKESFKARFDLLLFKHILEGDSNPISESELDAFRIEENGLLKKYLNIYWQKDRFDKLDEIVIEDIYIAMMKWKMEQKVSIVNLQNHYVKKTFLNVFPFEEFNEFVRAKLKCEYCHITEEGIQALINAHQLNTKKDTRGLSLEIDRKKPNYEYTKENCVWCCYWCNNAKTDEFSYDEFKKIGKVIESIWDGRLSRKSEPSV